MKKTLLVLALALLLTACASTPTETPLVRVGMLPVLDGLPIYVAQADGYFAEEGVQVEIIPVGSAPERDQLMQSGQIDAMINEVVSDMLYNKDGVQVVAVRFARTATAESPVFRIVASAQSGITDVDGLRGVPIGLSEGTVIEYTTDRMLEKAGFAPDEIVALAVPKIADRMNLLASGQLDAANLPDPAASLAILNGGVDVIDDTSCPEISNSVITFSKAYIDANPEAVRAFLRAVERAVAAINTTPNGWDDLLSEQNLVPAPLLGVYRLPSYPAASVPDEAQFNDALQWTLDKGLLTGTAPYTDTVDGSYLP
jgi:NitT/TauT family transport system substrate-binding protein